MKPAKTLIAIFNLNFIFTVTACSIYKSEGRKVFESKAPLHFVSGTGIKALRNRDSANQLELAPELTTGFTSANCEILSSFELDLRAHSISGTPEVLITQDGSELWKTLRDDGAMQITVITSFMSSSMISSMTSSQKAQRSGQEKQFSVCQHLFSSEEQWQQQENEFLLDY